MLPINFIFPETTLRVIQRTLTLTPYNALDHQDVDIPKLLEKIIFDVEQAAIGSYSLVNTYPAEPPTLQSPFHSVTTLTDLIFTLNTCLSEQQRMLKANYGSLLYASLINSLNTAKTVLNTALVLPKQSSLKPPYSTSLPSPHLVFNPIFISLTLLISKKQLVLSQYTSAKRTHSSLKDRLTSNTRKLKEAALQGYSLLNHFPEKNSSSSPDHPKNITDLQTLVIKLEKWIKHNSLPLLNQCGLSALRDIYKDLSEAANCLSLTSFQTLLQIENPPQTKHEPLLAYKASSTPVNSTPSLLLPPKKQKLKPPISDSSLPILSHIDKNLSIKKRLWKRSPETSIEAYSSPTKKHKSESPTPILGFFDLFTENLATDSSPLGSPLNLEELIETLRPETPIIHKAYEVEELTLAGNNIFTLTSITTEDLESWINHTHSLVGQCLNYPENLLVNSLADVSALEHESQTNLRKFTLQQLLKFMNRNLPFLSKIQDQQSHQEINALHSHLTKELENALSEIEKAYTLTEIRPPYNPLIKPIEIVKLPLIQRNFIKIKNCQFYFLLCRSKTMKSESEFKKFLKQAQKACALGAYRSLQKLPEIKKETSNNLLSSLIVLYFVTKQNYVNLKASLPYVRIDHDALNFLNTLNQKYCDLVGEKHDDLHHSNNLQEQNFPTIPSPSSRLSSIYLSYLTVSPTLKSPHTFWIKKILIPSPIHNSSMVLANWIENLNKHTLRMQNLHSCLQLNSVFLKCNDESWPLTHSTALPISQAQGNNVLSAISQYNLTLCTSYFVENSTEAGEIKHPGYFETNTILSFVASIFKTTSTEIPTPGLTTIDTQDCLPPNDNLFTSTHTPFISLRRPGSSYTLAVIPTLQTNKSNFSRIALHQTKNLKNHISNIVNNFSFPLIKTSNTPIMNLTTFISVMYWVIDCNRALMRNMFPVTFIKTQNFTKIDLRLKEAIVESKKIENILFQAWGKIHPDTPIPPYESLTHAFKETLTGIYKKINQQQ
ncbi:hypothetical protein CLAVI_000887 [Candidatus Clavichlamydia salmonicola]|uniref:hypothetical protein n=1 Tax=Candidatus Clavichlamydia salmonicola TaxID=469812 RepID=UPI001890BB39|nr:hypothetical protein [Candidatus Clavichlamydia salmonicola]MBF5051246.1 hypothetical protein [Candidatus Clavichlamydia salmonicola]